MVSTQAYTIDYQPCSSQWVCFKGLWDLLKTVLLWRKWMGFLLPELLHSIQQPCFLLFSFIAKSWKFSIQNLCSTSVNVKRVHLIILLYVLFKFLSHTVVFIFSLFLNLGWKCAQFSLPQGLFGWICGGKAPLLCSPGSSCRNLHRHLCCSELSSA